MRIRISVLFIAGHRRSHAEGRMTKTAQDLQWVRSPQQTRSQESLERILDAAESLIAEKGFEQTTVAEIVRLASSSVGAFYGRFREKDDLLRCLHDRFTEQAIATTDSVLDPARWEGSSIREILEETIPFLINVYRERLGLLRAFLIRESVDPEFAKGLPGHRHLAMRLRELIMARRHEMSHPSPAEAVEVMLELICGTLNNLALFQDIDEMGLKLCNKGFPGEMIRAASCYLGLGTGD